MTSETLKRREFIELTVAGSALLWGGSPSRGQAVVPAGGLLSPGCRSSKVKVARLYLGSTGLWPKPGLDLQEEKARYEAEFAKLGKELGDVEWVTDEIVTSPEQVKALSEKLQSADGILVIHLRMGIGALLKEVLAAGKPTMVFAIPYSGHEWAGFGALQKQPEGAKVGCLLTSDMTQLAVAIRPFRAIHHLREAKVINLTARAETPYYQAVKDRFGTTIQNVGLEPMLELYNSIDEKAAKEEADRWIQGAVAVVEPPTEEIVKSCRLALAFEKLLAQENATAMTADCYGTMYQPLCKTHAFPCVGFVRLNDMGLGGICESDLECAMTQIMFQGLVGRPGFISDPTVDESANSIILAHCLGTRKMDGPDGPMAPYKIRTIMEREEGAVPQVFMRVGQKVTQARFVGTDLIPFFTGEVIGAPDIDRGCRTKIDVRVDGSATRLWKNWANGLHRVTCYGDLRKDMEHFCRFMGVQMVDEAV